MKEFTAKALLASLILVLSGCISVHDRTPEAVSTTTTRRTTVTAPVPASTTVERTTVY